ncbi:MAG: hypothetical protein D6768_10015, partial [Chloroflexi bacterium]
VFIRWPNLDALAKQQPGSGVAGCKAKCLGRRRERCEFGELLPIILHKNDKKWGLTCRNGEIEMQKSKPGWNFQLVRR